MLHREKSGNTYLHDRVQEGDGVEQHGPAGVVGVVERVLGQIL
jgi:hypothetical protein